MTIRKNNGVMCATSSVEIDGISYTASTRMGRSISFHALSAEDSGETIHVSRSWNPNVGKSPSQKIASSMHKNFVSRFKQKSYE
jgi:hypothetical protein